MDDRRIVSNLSAAILLALGSAAQAQDAPPPAKEEEELDSIVDEVVVTGTRVAQRTRLESLAPVDVFSDEALTAQGTTELAEALSDVAPSLNFPRPSITDGTDHIRPATLRGLAPDQTLVLVNSKRRHPSALVNVNGSVGRGSAAVDLNAIPMAAIESVEVLRDGASAQYGSDAIAGVINLRLREAREGGSTTVTVGPAGCMSAQPPGAHAGDLVATQPGGERGAVVRRDLEEARSHGNLAIGRDADDLQHGQHRRQEKEDQHLRTADLQQRQARPESDGREERDHQRRAQGRVETKQRDVPLSRDQRRERDEQPANHGCR